MPQPLIWPLQRLSKADVQLLQAALQPAKFLQPIFARQRPRWTNGLLAPDLPVNLPWNTVGHPQLVDVPLTSPRVVHELKPIPPTYFRIAGITKDSTGAALGSCVVQWFNTADNRLMGTVTSDATGVFEFRTGGQPPNAYYLIAYKTGSPDVAGTTVSTLTGL